VAFEGKTFTAVVSSGDSVSETFTVEGAVIAGLWCPAVTSCQAYLQGSFDTTSANFVRVFKDDGSAAFTWDVAVGSASLPITAAVMPFPNFRVEFGVAQDTRTLHVHVKF